MIIKIKGSDNIIISNEKEFIVLLNKIINNLKDGYVPKELSDYYQSNKNNTISGIKKFKMKLKSFFYNKTILNSEYWISRGWDSEEAIVKIKKRQSDRSKVRHKKLKELKKRNISEWKSNFNTNIEFYIKRGYTKEEAEEKLTQRQRTFSKQICIEKHGKEKGLKVWKERQSKWISTLNNSDRFNHKKDSSSVVYYQQKYGKDWILKCIDKNFHCNKFLIINAIINTNDIDSFCDYIYENKNIYSVRELSSIFNSTTLQEYFNMTNQDLKLKLISKYGIIPTKFGNIREYNGHICRSNGEFYIAKKLNESNIEYVYEKRYPNSNYICDFYIPHINLYVEYMGFIKSSYMNKHNKKICDLYKKRYKLKEKMCLDNRINFIFDTEYKTIIDKIINYD